MLESWLSPLLSWLGLPLTAVLLIIIIIILIIKD